MVSIKDVYRGLYDNGGFFRFWKGSFLIGTASIPSHALYFSVYELAKVKLGVENKGFQFSASAITGAVATFFHDVILTPADSKEIPINDLVIKQRIQLSGSNKCMDCAKQILKNEGFLSFYRSLPITLVSLSVNPSS
jgi:solute carrier family 25 iron transporter 28/37